MSVHSSFFSLFSVAKEKRRFSFSQKFFKDRKSNESINKTYGHNVPMTKHKQSKNRTKRKKAQREGIKNPVTDANKKQTETLTAIVGRGLIDTSL